MAVEPASAGFFVDQDASDEDLVEQARVAREEAESAEAEAGSPHRWREAESYVVLLERGWTGKRVAEKCEVDQSRVSRFKNTFLRYRNLALADRPTFWHAYAEVTGEKQRVHYSSETAEWETPQALFDLLNTEFGFDFDVCATPENAKCVRYFTAEDDGLVQEWAGACWMNPPYGGEIGRWVAKAHESGDAGATVVCLIPARTDTSWWWDHARHGEVRFLRGRLQFGNAETGAPFPSAVVIFGREPCVKWWEAWQKD